MSGLLGGVQDFLFGSGPDFQGLADKQTRADRPNQSTPFGFSNWTEGPNGTWSQQTGFNGPLQGAFDGLAAQWGANAGQGYGNGWDAFQKAWDAEQGLLNPLWDQRQTAARSQLLNTGADIGSPIYSAGMRDFGDARSRADMQAIQGAFGAQGQMFNQNRQAWMDPLNALQGMQGLLQMPGVPGAADYVGAGQQEANWDKYQNQLMGDLIQKGGQAAITGMTGAPPMGGGSTPFSFNAGQNPLSPGQLTPPQF